MVELSVSRFDFFVERYDDWEQPYQAIGHPAVERCRQIVPQRTWPLIVITNEDLPDPPSLGISGKSLPLRRFVWRSVKLVFDLVVDRDGIVEVLQASEKTELLLYQISNGYILT